MDRRPVAYLRKSSGSDPQGTFEDQSAAVLRLSAARGEPLPVVTTRAEADAHADYFTDWGKSGGSGAESRPGYAALLAALEAGTVSTVYAYDEERLARDVELWSRLLNLADRHGFVIVTAAGVISDPDQRMMAHVKAAVAEDFLRRVKVRNRANRDRRIRRGDDLGRCPYGRRPVKGEGGAVTFERVPGGPLDTVLAAVEAERGNIARAARALNGQGILPPRGSRWGSATLKALVEREAPDLLPDKRIRRGRPSVGPRYLSGLMRCPGCGGSMSPNANGKDWTCWNGMRDPAHPKPYSVAESRVLPFVKDEAARLIPYAERVTYPGPDVEAERARLTARLTALGDRYEAEAGTPGGMTADTYRERVAALRADLDRLAAVEDARSDAVPSAVDWEGGRVEDVADVLRALFVTVRLDYVTTHTGKVRLAPVEAVWADPTLRRGD